MNHNHRQATAMVVGQIIKDKFTSVGRVYKPHHIIEDMRKEYGVNISYGEARRARELPMLLLEVLQKTHTSFCMLMEKH